MRERTVELTVGLFILVGFVALVFLAMKVSGLSELYTRSSGYTLSAEFKNVGNLKVRAPVRVGGVRIGEVTSVQLDSKSYYATVTMRIQAPETQLPMTTSASIYTAGLLGANFVSLDPYGTFAVYDDDDTSGHGKFLTAGSQLDISHTHSAMILEDLIGQLMFKLTKPEGKAKKSQ